MIVLLWSFLTHIAGIFLFTRGFLLTRLSLPNTTPANYSLPASHSRAIIVLIDSLRFDFIAPHPPSPPNPFHHNVLTLPRDLTATRPRNSFIFNAYSDPPTTTLQRIKAITTGSLPTFVDIGSNFGASHVAEDSLLNQLSLHHKKLAFMGDDTWLSVFPSSFSPNLSFPFDSFNVEDLHTVDNGIVSHLFPLLSNPDPPFDILIAHFLGVDHIGHRLGPDNPSMRSKLLSLNSILKLTIEKLPPKTLLIVLGDHGMDTSGDHGGDGVLETSSGLWVYSKDRPLFNSTRSLPPDLLDYRIFPASSVKSRAVEQIDLVPTLALLLGLPIPYNNLGTVIPELFWLDRQGKYFEQALSLNAEQIMTFLRTYRASSLGSDLDDFWDSLSASYASATQNTTTLSQDQKFLALLTFTRSALKACRSIWAQFNPILMCFGLLIHAASLVASYSLYSNYPIQHERDKWLASLIARTAVYTLLGCALGLVAHSLFRPISVSLPHFLILTTSLSSSVSIVLLSPPPLPSFLTFTSLLPLLHSLSFLSNSFTFWEDRTLPFLLLTSLLPHLFLSFLPTTPSPLRIRTLTHLLILALCSRLMAISTVCREEQQPYCSVTFFASRSVPEPPRIVLYLILPIAFFLPSIIQSYPNVKKHWSIRLFFKWVLRPALLLGTMFWIVEWLDSANQNVNSEWTILLRKTRTRLAWSAIGWLVLAGGFCWWVCPNEKEEEEEEDNELGTRFLILWSILFGIVWVCTQLTGQATLALATIALLSYLQIVSCSRTAEVYRSRSNPSLQTSLMYPTPSPTPLALLTLLTFYSTGHQAAFSSIQWKAGFVLTENVRTSSSSSSSSWLANINISVPLSGLTVVLNSVGGIAVWGGLGAGLVGCWRARPATTLSKPKPKLKHDDDTPQPQPPPPPPPLTPTQSALLTTLSTQTYFLLLLLGSSIGAAVLRRHLMVWKVFAPRFMVGVLELVVLDVAGLVVGLAMRGGE